MQTTVVIVTQQFRVCPLSLSPPPRPPGSLDLDAWINEPPSDSESEDEKPRTIFHEEEQRASRHRQPEMDEEELARVRRLRGAARAGEGNGWPWGLGQLSFRGSVMPLDSSKSRPERSIEDDALPFGKAAGQTRQVKPRAL